MNIQTIRDNLIKTIEGKEAYLAATRKNIAAYDASATQGDGWMVATTIAEMLEINLDELKKILKDVTICCTNETIAKWVESPDRSGGQYTEEEINRGSAW
jgi:hypothetical protein